MSEGSALISFRGIAKRFEHDGSMFTAVEDVQLDVAPGEFCCVVGPSGCGKSTLLNMSAGLMEPSAGTVHYAGSPVPKPNTKVGYITQKDNVLPWRTVFRNVALPLELRQVDKAEIRERVSAMLDLVGLTGFAKAYPRQLSGGMRKRVALARTLVYEPEAILADEPFGALDAQLKTILQAELRRIWERTGTTFIFVTHDIGEAITLGDRVVVMSQRPGRISMVCDVDIPRPRDVFKVRFDARYAELFEQLWSALSDEVEQELAS
ncbi:NitT/TauT family transport system ATP-binding protein [Tamaricihabitans halophyticus]|uniref:NitT/TauT family transport system ATP-binding protein n=1 Tax=Tamaricihabitans halophyticus TaxID=1262583 RepID=A0A4R2R420_9PSEU|nr:ABC transporter ATP-binding protein [Tamaricihabitans halophyticus]TCP56634.1 NitT/TauT family transport system ATP-binding protein [Tamaricihabitans halophyticus]